MGMKAIGQGLKIAIQEIVDIEQVFAPDEMPDTINVLPCAIILPGETTYETTFGAEYEVTFRIIILLGKADLPSALNRITDYADTSGDDSIRVALYADGTLDGACDDVILVRNNGAGFTTWGAITYLSTEFEVRCI